MTRRIALAVNGAGLAICLLLFLVSPFFLSPGRVVVSFLALVLSAFGWIIARVEKTP